jgi:hypothetical protein
MTVTYRCQYVRCCNPRCRACPHGPYWYGFWKEGGRTRSCYYGKKDPRPPAPRVVKASELERWRAMFERRTASVELAQEILGLGVIYDQDAATQAYRKRCMDWHPDRQGDSEKMQMANAAWSYLRAFYHWR